jgi:hypothetical protein
VNNLSLETASEYYWLIGDTPELAEDDRAEPKALAASAGLMVQR